MPLRCYLAGGIFILTFFLTPILFASEVKVQKDDRGHWTLLADGKKYFIRGVDYRVSKAGQSPDLSTLGDWMDYDFDRNHRCNPAYDSWVDRNHNNRRDREEPVTGDFELLRSMGVNTIRWYVNDFRDQLPDKKISRDLYSNYGIRVAVAREAGACDRVRRSSGQWLQSGIPITVP